MSKQEVDKAKVFEYLDTLKTSGVIDMFDSAPYIKDQFGVSMVVAIMLVDEWLKQKGVQR